MLPDDSIIMDVSPYSRFKHRTLEESPAPFSRESRRPAKGSSFQYTPGREPCWFRTTDPGARSPATDRLPPVERQACVDDRDYNAHNRRSDAAEARRNSYHRAGRLQIAATHQCSTSEASGQNA